MPPPVGAENELTPCDLQILKRTFVEEGALRRQAAVL